jgi:hypothetical protein
MAKADTLPDSIWTSLRQGVPQRLLVSIEASDLALLPRAQQLRAYEIRKQAILQALPVDGAKLLRQLEQLPMLELEVRTESALRLLLAHCWVAEAYLDREEPMLAPKGPR